MTDDDTLYPLDIELARLDAARGSDSLPYYDRKGRAIPFSRWARLKEIGDPAYGPDREHYQVVARTRIEPYVVSTVWLGTDHGFSPIGPPVIFETMVFGTDAWDRGGVGPDFDCRRYCTEQEAIAGHRETVTVVRASVPGDPPVTWEYGTP